MVPPGGHEIQGPLSKPTSVMVLNMTPSTLLVLMAAAVVSSPLPLAREVRALHQEVRELRDSLREAVPINKAIVALDEDILMAGRIEGGGAPLLEDVGGGDDPPLLLRVEQVYLDSRAPMDRLTAALAYSPVAHGGMTWTCRDTETGRCPLVVALSSPSARVPTLMTLSAIEAESKSLYLLLCPPEVGSSMAPVWEEEPPRASVCAGNVTLNLGVERDLRAPPESAYMTKLLHDAFEGARQETLILNEDAGHRVWAPMM